MNKLYVIDGPDKGKSFDLDDGITTIGRSPDNDICISDMGVSRYHAKLLRKGGKFFITDVSSFQGILIDREKIEPGLESEIKKESNLIIGNTILSFQKEFSGKKLAKPYTKDVERKPFDTSNPLKNDSRDYTHSLELLLKVSNILTQSLHINELLDEIINQTFNLLKRVDRGAILLLNKETGKLEEVVSKTRMEDKEDLLPKINYSRTIINRAIKEGMPAMMPDTSRVDKADLSDSIEQMNVRSLMCVPLKYKGEVQGVIYVDSIGLPNGFRKDDLQLLTGLSNTAAIAIENARLHKIAKQELSERKLVERQIKASLREKELLLKEIHHRVKNNFQVISSLLDLSSLRTRDKEAISLFTDARTKIHTMAFIHAQLYQNDRFDKIDMQSHIRDIITHLSQLYGAKKNITPIINAYGVSLSVTHAIPCALVLNELVSNVFRHAFEEGKEGTVEVSMEQSSDVTISVKVKDDGIGMPEEIDIHKVETLGLKLVRNLVQKQLRGKLQIERNNGTEIVIEFKVLKEK